MSLISTLHPCSPTAAYAAHGSVLTDVFAGVQRAEVLRKTQDFHSERLPSLGFDLRRSVECTPYACFCKLNKSAVDLVGRVHITTAIMDRPVAGPLVSLLIFTGRKWR